MLFGVPNLATYIFLPFLLNELGLGTGVDPDITLTPFTS